MSNAKDVLNELDARRTFSAFLLNRSESTTPDPTQRSHLHSKSIPKSKSYSIAKEFPYFILSDKLIYRQRKWISKLAKQICDEQLQQSSQCPLTPVSTPYSNLTLSKKATKRRKDALRKMTPGTTLMSIGESCSFDPQKQPTIMRSSQNIDFKAWPAFRQYKSIINASNASRIPNLMPKPIVIRPSSQNQKKITTLTQTTKNLPPTLARIINAKSGRLNDSPPLKSIYTIVKPISDPLFPLHLIKLAIIDGDESKACSILSHCFGLPNPLGTTVNPLGPTALKVSFLLKPKFWPTILRIWLRAVDKGMETLLIMLLNAGIPASPIAPISFIAPKKLPTQQNRFYSLAGFSSTVSILSTSSSATGNSSSNWVHKNYRDWLISRFPSYIIAAIAFGRDRLVKAMLESSRKQAAQIVQDALWLGFSPLLLASGHGKGHMSITKELLEYGADPMLGIPYYYYLLTKRKLCPHILKVKATRRRKSSLDQLNWAKETSLLPIEVAAAAGNFGLVMILIGHCVMPMHLALLVQSDLDISIRLLKAGALVNVTGPYGNSPIHKAASDGRTDLLAVYLHYGANIDATNEQGSTALHIAALHEHRQTFAFLIEEGADCSIQNLEGLTALEVARRKGFPSEFLEDCFSIKKKPNVLEDDMRALISEVESYKLQADIPKPEQKTQQRKGRFLIEKIVGSGRWWSN